MRVRQSSLKAFGNCAYQYYLRTLPNLDRDEEVGSLTVFGTVFHYAVDVYESYGYDLDLAKRTFIKYWDRPELLGERVDFWHRRTNKSQLKKRGLALLEKYHDLAVWRDEGAVLGTEIHFIVPIGDHELEGTIDKLAVSHGRSTIKTIDFKTAAAVPAKLRENVQFTAYSYATTTPEFWSFVPGHEDGYEQFKNYRRQGWWYHARDGKFFNAGYRGKVDYRRLLLAIEQMENAIQHEVFPLSINGETCGWCEFVDGICGAEMSEWFEDYVD